jgi:predicted transposase/invertase (TIGR01784 family)
MSLINSIVSEADQVSDITLLNPYNPRNFKNDKLSILDIKALGKNGKRFNIELQITDEASYDKRALYYWAKLYTEQLSQGDSYDKLSKTIGIHILNFTSIVGVDKYHNVFHITEKETGEPYFTDLELHTIELKKFNGAASDGITDLVSKITTSLDVWVAFLTRHELLRDKEHLPKQLNDIVLKKALEVLEVMRFTADEREGYEERLKWLRMEASALEKAEEKGIEKGIEIGIEMGEARGIEIGEARGIEMGQIHMKRIMALSLLKQRVDTVIVSNASGLSLDEITQLQQEMLCELA